MAAMRVANMWNMVACSTNMVNEGRTASHPGQKNKSLAKAGHLVDAHSSR
jgi:hypothetical protein